MVLGVHAHHVLQELGVQACHVLQDLGVPACYVLQDSGVQARHILQDLGVQARHVLQDSGVQACHAHLALVARALVPQDHFLPLVLVPHLPSLGQVQVSLAHQDPSSLDLALPHGDLFFCVHVLDVEHKQTKWMS